MKLVKLRETKSTIRFSAKLFGPEANAKTGSWTLTLPKNASAKLPSRGMTMVEGTLERKLVGTRAKRKAWTVTPTSPKERECEASIASHDEGGGNDQWLPFPSR